MNAVAQHPLSQQSMKLVLHGRLDLTPLLTHTFSLDDITKAYKLFGERREGAIKVAIKP
jgi:alcohol dehydrogenase